MSSRPHIGFALLVMALVGSLAGEGGPLDRFAAGSQDPPTEAGPAPSPQPTGEAQGAVDFFSLQEDWAETGSEGVIGFDDPAEEFAPPSTKKFIRPTLGALSKEQLNVEVPVGLASMREPPTAD